ncbi:MAG: hypothetical protein HY980_03565 [Candidatus Magasanikbacteria bacterium]|nr:hypothetical protein [Candidatus Magasanikbacteria bacterium]
MPVKKLKREIGGPQFTKIDLESAVESPKIRRRKVAVKPEKESALVSAKKEEKKINRELREIYENDDGTMPDMSDFKKNRRSRLSAFITLLIACVFLAAVAWAGFFFFQPGSGFVEKDVILSVAGEEEIVYGQEVNYRIRYRNGQSVPLAKVTLQARYPEGFVFESSSREPSNEKKDEWDLGTLGQQDSGYIDVRGRLYGNLGAKQSLRAFLNYTPANFSSEFQAVAAFNTEVKESPLAMTVSGPTEAASGSEVEFKIELEKNIETDLPGLFLAIEPAGGFNKTTSTLSSMPDNQYRWDLSGWQEGQILVRGKFNPAVGEETAEMMFKLLGEKLGSNAAEPYVVYETKALVKMLKTDLSAGLAINGAMDSLSVQPGEDLNTSLIIKNSGQSAIKNLKVKLVYETPSFDNKSLLDWKKIDDAHDGAITGEQINGQTRRGTITWTDKQVPGLKQLDSGKEVLLDLKIPLKDAADLDLTKFVGYSAMAMVEVKYQDGAETKIMSGNKINLTVNSDLRLAVSDKVVEDAQGVKGQEMHLVSWVLNNTFHDLKNIELRADIYNIDGLPGEAQVVPAGKFEWDKANTEVVWKIETMPTSVDVLALQFGLVLKNKNPSQTNLTSKVKITAEDTITGQQIILSGDEVLLN